MGTEQLDLRRTHAGRNQSLFREVNERINDLGEKFLVESEDFGYVCECLDLKCTERIAMPHDEYDRIRRNPIEFFVAPGHEYLDVEEVVDRGPRWVIVRKIGAGAAVAAQFDSAGGEPEPTDPDDAS